MKVSFEEWYFEAERLLLMRGGKARLRDVPEIELRQVFDKGTSARQFVLSLARPEVKGAGRNQEGRAPDVLELTPVILPSSGSPNSLTPFPSTTAPAPVGARVCLGCGAGDLFSVSALYSQGTWSTSSQSVASSVAVTSHGDIMPGLAYGHGVGHGQTDLARTLSPPARPYYRKDGFGCDFLLLTGVPFLAGLFMCFLYVAVPQNYSPLFFLFGVLLALSTYLIHWSAKNQLDENNRRALQVWKANELEYRRKLAKWQALYYCGRCDSVSDHATGRVVRSSLMSHLIE